MLLVGCLAVLLAFIVDTIYPENSHNDIESIEGHENMDTLVLVHVLFRHGNRTADVIHELYPNDPYIKEKYFPYGMGQLTNTGKKKLLTLGKSLQKRYNEFLGEYYYPEMIDALSTDYNRTKMSLQLVLAGLFPPNTEQIFENDLFWQPVPFNYHPRAKDKILLGVLCPNYLRQYDEVTNQIHIQNEFKQHSDIFIYISDHSGLNVTRFLDIYNLYFGISTEQEWGFELPEWTQTVWPEIITNLAIREYFVAMDTAEMRQMAIGYLLQKIIEDTKTKILSSQLPGRKMHLYSGHENNIAQLLMSLDVFDAHVPNYGAHAILEIHLINKVYGVKMYYENYDGKGLRLLKMPNCEEFCPLDNFIDLTKHLMPTEDLCG